MKKINRNKLFFLRDIFFTAETAIVIEHKMGWSAARAVH